MRYQDQLVRSTQKAMADVTRAALAIPVDKVDWVPMGSARSTLDQLQEIAGSSEWFLYVFRERKAPDDDGSAVRAAVEKARGLLTVNACLEVAQQGTNELCHAISEFPDEDLEREVKLPFGGGVQMTFAEVLGLHYWNLIYHLGQINQIQLMLGDVKMH